MSLRFVVLGRDNQRQGAFVNHAWQYYLKSSFRELTLRYRMIRLLLTGVAGEKATASADGIGLAIDR
jgi:hypothetical protein